MPDQRWSAKEARRVVKRIVVEGRLKLVTPAHLGNGDGDAFVDLPLLRDHDGRPLLAGAGLAGALRAYLVQRGQSYGQAEQALGAAERLFGGRRQDDDGLQSPLIVDDARATEQTVEVRDGVALDVKRRAAKAQTKYNLELWPEGTVFPLRFELVITAKPSDDVPAQRWVAEEDLKRALATALDGLARGEIRLGLRKSRGFGEMAVDAWRVREYDLTTAEGLLAWLAEGSDDTPDDQLEADADIVERLGATLGVDRRRRFVIDATFDLDSSLLIRSGSGVEDAAPDMTHLHSARAGRPTPVLSGTSLAGAVRARAQRIAMTLWHDEARVKAALGAMFGNTPDGRRPDSRQSRLFVDEQVIEGGRRDLVQSRISIDRFTGGVLDGHLFSQQPVWAGPDGASVKLRLELREPAAHEVGLLLQVLKDLWTGDLPLGGEQSVGRGRLTGREATLTWHEGHDPPATWRLEATDEGLAVEGDLARLNDCAAALVTGTGEPT